jgi:hypothetical protein
MARIKSLMLGYQLIAVVGILLVGLFVSELMEDSKRQSEAWLITRLVLAVFLYVYVILSLVPLWAFFSEWRSRGCKAIMRRLASMPSVLLLLSLVALVAVDSVSFLVKQEDRALFGAFHVLSIICALFEFVFLMIRQRQAKEDMRMNSRVCDLLVMSIVCIYSALAIVDVVGSAYGYAHRVEKKLPEIVPISTLVLPLVVEFHRNIARHWLKFNFEPHAHKRGERVCFPGEGLLLFIVAALMMLAIAFLPTTGRYLFALLSVLVGSVFFYMIFALWHWAPDDNAIYRELAAHWVVITFDRVLLGITSSVTSVIFIVFICTQAENVMAVITLLLLLFTHIMQTFFMIWLMDVKKISSNWTRLGRFCQMAMIVYNLYAFLLYAFYANNAYESSSAAGKVVIVVSFFVATSFWDLAIHWSEFSFVRPEDAQEVIEEEHGYVYHTVGEVDDDLTYKDFQESAAASGGRGYVIEGGAQAD